MQVLIDIDCTFHKIKDIVADGPYMTIDQEILPHTVSNTGEGGQDGEGNPHEEEAARAMACTYDESHDNSGKIAIYLVSVVVGGFERLWKQS